MVHNFLDLTGKVAIVTGASRGLGQYFGKALARAGADLVITSRRKESLYEFQEEIEGLGRKAYPLQLDVDIEESIHTMVERAVEHYGKIDILVNNAGLNIRKPALDVTWEDWDTIVNTFLKGTFFVAQAVAKHMVERRYGRIINIGSVNCVFGYAGTTPYCASRGGVMQLTKSLALDWGKYGITGSTFWPRLVQDSSNCGAVRKQGMAGVPHGPNSAHASRPTSRP